jgi:hypothetical protein
MEVSRQSQDWTWGYVVLLGLFVATMAAVGKRMPATAVRDVEAVRDETITWARRLRWLFLAFVPSSLFIGVTTYLTTDIVVMPLLWVMPLAIYLLSMVFVFAKRPPIPHKLIVAIFPFALAGMVFVVAAQLGQFKMIAFGAHLLMLFIACMLCHGELAKDRPAPARLTEFFLIMSCGGVLGGMFNALVAPLVFVHVVEYALMLAVLGLAMPGRREASKPLAYAYDLAAPVAITTLVMIPIWARETNRLLINSRLILIILGTMALICAAIFSKRPIRFALGLAGLLLLGVYKHSHLTNEILSERSFFGVYRVTVNGTWHVLTNGRILHGQQSPRTDIADQPQTYYHRLGPLKEVLDDWARPPGSHVGAIGLGTGTLALWSKPGERWTFFEIDPTVERIARDTRMFTCISLAQGDIDVKIGDARLSLEHSSDKFDVILMDAFSSDAIPAHLLTLEAMKVYESRLTPNGRLAVHISNRFLELEPVVKAIADKMGWASYICDEPRDGVVGEEKDARSSAAWMVLGPPSLDWTAITNSSRWKRAVGRPDIEAWTDAYSSLLPVLRPSAFQVF